MEGEYYSALERVVKGLNRLEGGEAIIDVPISGKVNLDKIKSYLHNYTVEWNYASVADSCILHVSKKESKQNA